MVKINDINKFMGKEQLRLVICDSNRFVIGDPKYGPDEVVEGQLYVYLGLGTENPSCFICKHEGDFYYSVKADGESELFGELLVTFGAYKTVEFLEL